MISVSLSSYVVQHKTNKIAKKIHDPQLHFSHIWSPRDTWSAGWYHWNTKQFSLLITIEAKHIRFHDMYRMRSDHRHIRPWIPVHFGVKWLLRIEIWGAITALNPMTCSHSLDCRSCLFIKAMCAKTLSACSPTASVTAEGGFYYKIDRNKIRRMRKWFCRGSSVQYVSNGSRDWQEGFMTGNISLPTLVLVHQSAEEAWWHVCDGQISSWLVWDARSIGLLIEQSRRKVFHVHSKLENRNLKCPSLIERWSIRAEDSPVHDHIHSQGEPACSVSGSNPGKQRHFRLLTQTMHCNNMWSLSDSGLFRRSWMETLRMRTS